MKNGVMPKSNLHKILSDPECAGNIKCAVWATVIACLYFSGMCYGFALLELAHQMNPIEKQMKSIGESFNKKVTKLHKIHMLHERAAHHGH